MSPKIKFRNGILGKQYFTVLRNSTVDLWEKKLCYDTCNRAQTAWKGNNLASNACNVLDMNASGVLVGRQDLWIVGKRFLEIRSSVALMQVIICMGYHWDLSSLKTQPGFNRSKCTTKLLIWVETGSARPPRPSSRKITMVMPLLPRDFRSALKILVNTKGAEDSPNGRTQSWNVRNFDAREKLDVTKPWHEIKFEY